MVGSSLIFYQTEGWLLHFFLYDHVILNTVLLLFLCIRVSRCHIIFISLSFPGWVWVNLWMSTLVDLELMISAGSVEACALPKSIYSSSKHNLLLPSALFSAKSMFWIGQNVALCFGRKSAFL